MKIVCMIPARLESSRVHQKNLRYLGDKPLVAHVLETCVQSGLFEEVYLNSDGLLFKDLAEEFGAKFFHRSSEFALPHITNDLFMEDFMRKTECDAVIQVNPTSPFISKEDIEGVLKLIKEGADTVHTVKEERIEGLFEGKPLNYNPNEIMPESQKLTPVTLFSSSVMGFKKDTYLKNMQDLGAATYGGKGKTLFHTLSGFSNLDIDWEEDFQLAEVIWEKLNSPEKPIRYYGEELNEVADADRERIHKAEGIEVNTWNEFNKLMVNIQEIIERNPKDKNWSHTLVNSPSNCVTLLAQVKDEGNREHYHTNWDEWWYIVQGQWEFVVEGVAHQVKQGDFIFIPRYKKHHIKAISDQLSIRMAVSRADVDHIYQKKDY